MAKNTSSKKDSFMDEFNRNPSEKNWDLFAKRLKRDRAKYYYVVYPKGIKDRLSLKDAYLIIYDSKYRQLYRIPIIKSGKNGIEGATIYLKDLEVNRRMIS